MSLDKETALDMLDQNLEEFDILEKRIRKEGISDECKDLYNEFYIDTVDIVSKIFSEEESSNFTQQVSIPTYDIDPEEEDEIYHQSVLECITIIESYRERLSKDKKVDKNIVKGK